ncbi:hypothetical protein CDD81_7910 [Ophiocordyceps australis]|uniref:Uncharacterized protein n=1 Tax=Ophiocordyceps australis TaxID=1399860 RepID=A0A2C5YC77_9HYPO|nr:hypothetical protein CDD81_7910 [Ophiocordyceps australis]
MPQRAQTLPDGAAWRPRLLVAACFLELLLATSSLGLYASRLSSTVRRRHGSGRPAELAWETTTMAASLAAAACSIYGLVRCARHMLTPSSLLYTQLLQAGCATLLLILSTLMCVRGSEKSNALAPLILSAMLLLTAAALVAYAIWAPSRFKAHYTPPDKAKTLSFGTISEGALSSLHTSRPSSAGSWRTGSDSHLKYSVYNHKRDTQFDDYVSILLSSPVGSRPQDIFKAIRSNGPPPSNPPTTVSLVKEERSPPGNDVLGAVQEEDECGETEATRHHETRRPQLYTRRPK